MSRILLIEDDVADQKLVKASIAAVNPEIKIQTANNAEDALEILRTIIIQQRQSDLPNLILLDLNMPGMGGREFLRRVKSHETLRRVPIVVLTSSKNEKDISESYLLQAAGYLQKPPSLLDLNILMQGLEKYWFNMCKLPSWEQYGDR
jgi:CheY-like chemotaxis protein